MIERSCDDARRAAVAVARAERNAPANAGTAVADALRKLASWRGAERMEIGRRVPRMWAKEIRA